MPQANLTCKRPTLALLVKSVLLGMTAAAVLTITPAAAASNDFIGHWVNTDRDTDGLTRLAISRLVISRQGRGPLQVQGFGQCTTQDCDWGSTRLNLYAPRATASFLQDFKRTLLTLILVNDSTMRVCTYTDFTDNSGLSDYLSCGTLKKRGLPQIELTPPGD